MYNLTIDKTKTFPNISDLGAQGKGEGKEGSFMGFKVGNSTPESILSDAFWKNCPLAWIILKNRKNRILKKERIGKDPAKLMS